MNRAVQKYTHGLPFTNSQLVKHYRSHHSRTEPNIMAFKGLYVNTKKFEDFMHTNMTAEPSTDYKEFYNYLLQMNELVPKELLRN